MPRKYKRKARKTRRFSRRVGDPYDGSICLSNVVTILQGTSGYPAFDLHYKSLSRFYNGVGTLVNASKLKDLYDEYRPVKCILEYTPLISESYVGTSTLVTIPPAVMVYDPDNSGFTGVQSMLSHRSSQTVSMTKKWKKTFRFPNYGGAGIQGASTLGWFNMQVENADEMQYGIISTKGLTPTNLTAGTAIGVLRVKMYVAVKGRNDANPTAYYGVDQFGNTMLTEPAWVALPIKPEDGLHSDQQ